MRAITRATVIITNADKLLRLQTIALRFSSSYNKTRANRLLSSSLPNNMSLHHCSPIQTTKLHDKHIPISQTHSTVICSQTLVILMGWMSAKDTHLQKIRQMWHKRGCNVLTVRTSPVDMLMPVIGNQFMVNNLANYLLEINRQYRHIVVHTFSSGGLRFGSFLHKLRSTDQYNTIGQSIRGIICDSFVDTHDISPGIARLIVTNAVLQRLLKQMIDVVFIKLFAMNIHSRSSYEFYNMYVRCDALVLYSESDALSNANTISKLISAWNALGMSVRSKCWHTSQHVSHYREHPLEYEHQIDAFLKLINVHNFAGNGVVVA